MSSLEGAPEKVGESFYCVLNKLTSLVGSPEKVGKTFDCWQNQLTSLEGSPKEVGGDFNCSYNKLKSTKGKPKYIGGEMKSDKHFISKVIDFIGFGKVIVFIGLLFMGIIVPVLTILGLVLLSHFPALLFYLFCIFIVLDIILSK